MCYSIVTKVSQSGNFEMSQDTCDPMEALALKFIRDAASPTTEVEQRALKVLTARLSSSISSEHCLTQCRAILGTPGPAQNVNAIMETPAEPITFVQRADVLSQKSPRSKARNWSAYEDQRLLAGVRKFGLNNWPMVAQFVGNWRTRSQCSQRWFRGLNPSLFKGPWTEEEEAKLVKLVQEFGEKSWKRIAVLFGNRSDVQCRYHYQQMQKHRDPDTTPVPAPTPDVQLKDVLQAPAPQPFDFSAGLDEMMDFKAEDRYWNADALDGWGQSAGSFLPFDKW